MKYCDAVVAALRKIAAAHLLHSDLKWEHVMLRGNVSSVEVVVVDLKCDMIEDETEDHLLAQMMQELNITMN